MSKDGTELNTFEVIPDEVDATLIKHRATSGIFILSLRRVIAQIVLTVGNILLARILFPEIIGSFTILNFYITFFSVVSDIGLGQALVQEKRKPTLIDLRTVFTAHMLLSLASFIVLYCVSPYLIAIYGGQLEPSNVFYLRFLAISLFFLNFRKVSAFLLERDLRFVELSIAEVVEILSIQAFTILFALNGRGIESYIYGTVIGRLIGTVVQYLLFPWSLGISMSFQPIKRFLKFGLPFQANMLVGFVNGALAPLYIGLFPGPGGFSGVQAVGYLTWAGGIALASRAISEVVQRIVFPAISRFQDNMVTMQAVVRRGLFLTCFLSFPFIGILVGLAVPFTAIVYTSKWLPGVFVLVLLLLQSVFSVLWTVITPVFFGLGLSVKVRNINIVWTLLQWLLTIPLVMRYGFVGFAWAQLLSSVIVIYPIIFIRKRIGVSLMREIFPYLGLSAVSGFFVFSYQVYVGVESLWELTNIALVGLFVYLALVYLFFRKDVIEHLKKARSVVFSKPI